MRFFIDINRDYTSWWQLEIDQRGWTFEALMDDRSWDPKYYVATHLDSEVWQIEAAIPLDELAPSEYQNEFWAFGVERVIPQRDVETWRPYTDSAKEAALQGVLRLPKVGD